MAERLKLVNVDLPDGTIETHRNATASVRGDTLYVYAARDGFVLKEYPHDQWRYAAWWSSTGRLRTRRPADHKWEVH